MNRLQAYPPIEPYKTGFLQVSAEHELYYEESGNPEGQPALFLHGGPGSGTDPSQRRFFDPKHYRIILMDQRGCGKSTPHASLNDNTTWHLVADIEALRNKLKIDRWLVFGGSWGSTLALAYAQTHPERCTALVLRGIFLCRKKEIRWFYQFGAHHIFPEEWQRYQSVIPPNEREDMVSAYYKRLTSPDETTRLNAAKGWSRWEASTISLIPNMDLINRFTGDHMAVAIARIECHYFMNAAFFKTDNWLIENVDKIRHIPAVIINGRYDAVCPTESAWELHQAWPEAKLEVIPDAGHYAGEPGIMDALIRATNSFRK
ncbi:MAG: prolyl aminopeptidase [Bdellovibrionales bacterium]|nr:prolyl aminopeptidase [Bdellovibrionales bacterium]